MRAQAQTMGVKSNRVFDALLLAEPETFPQLVHLGRWVSTEDATRVLTELSNELTNSSNPTSILACVRSAELRANVAVPNGLREYLEEIPYTIPPMTFAFGAIDGALIERAINAVPVEKKRAIYKIIEQRLKNKGKKFDRRKNSPGKNPKTFWTFLARQHLTAIRQSNRHVVLFRKQFEQALHKLSRKHPNRFYDPLLPLEYDAEFEKALRVAFGFGTEVPTPDELRVFLMSTLVAHLGRLKSRIDLNGSARELPAVVTIVPPKPTDTPLTREERMQQYEQERQRREVEAISVPINVGMDVEPPTPPPPALEPERIFERIPLDANKLKTLKPDQLKPIIERYVKAHWFRSSQKAEEFVTWMTFRQPTTIVKILEVLWNLDRKVPTTGFDSRLKRMQGLRLIYRIRGPRSSTARIYFFFKEEREFHIAVWDTNGKNTRRQKHNIEIADSERQTLSQPATD